MLMQRDIEGFAGDAIDPAVIRKNVFAAQKRFYFS